MFSIIIPTMWRSHRTIPLLESLNKCEEVGEIYIVNNNPEKTPKEISHFNKITEYKSGKNEYVNPSWNLGVKNCKYNSVALCNDDITFDVSFFKRLPMMDDTLLGIDSTGYTAESKTMKLHLLETTKRNWGFGCLMIFKKEYYRPIPDELKIWFGDDYLFEKFKKVYNIRGLPILTEMSVTSGEMNFHPIILQDEKNYKLLKLNETI